MVDRQADSILIDNICKCYEDGRALGKPSCTLLLYTLLLSKLTLDICKERASLLQRAERPSLKIQVARPLSYVVLSAVSSLMSICCLHSVLGTVALKVTPRPAASVSSEILSEMKFLGPPRIVLSVPAR